MILPNQNQNPKLVRMGIEDILGSPEDLREILRDMGLDKEQPVETKKESQITNNQQQTNLPKYSFLGGELGKQADDWIHKKYSGVRAFENIRFNENDMLVNGSNPFYVVAVNEFFREKYPNLNIRTATQLDLENILRVNALPLRDSYEDTALVYRNNHEPNGYLANNLNVQFISKGINLIYDTSYILPLFGLSLRRDITSSNGLSFKIPDKPFYAIAPVLNSRSNMFFDPNNLNLATGLPEKLYSEPKYGNRKLITGKNGLSWLFMGCSLCLNSNGYNLDDSNDSGRIVIVNKSGVKIK